MVTPNPRSTLTALDLFSGAGGLSLGLKRAGFRLIGAVEIDPLAVETYKKNHAEVRVWDEDICDVSLRSIKQKLGLKPGELGILVLLGQKSEAGFLGTRPRVP
jgi:DNA (cytosine-5)-methyltransferase 1